MKQIKLYGSISLVALIILLTNLVVAQSVYDDDPNCTGMSKAEFEYLTGMKYSSDEWLDLAGNDGIKRVCDFQVGLYPNRHIQYDQEYDYPAFVAMCMRSWNYNLPSPEKFPLINLQGVPSVYREGMQLKEFHTLDVGNYDRMYIVIYQQNTDAIVGVYHSTEDYINLDQGRCGIWRVEGHFE